MQLRGIQFALMPNRWIIITANLFGRQMCGYGEITTLFEFIIIFPPQPRPFWLILTSQIYRITARSLFSFSVLFLQRNRRALQGVQDFETTTKYLFSLDSSITFDVFRVIVAAVAPKPESQSKYFGARLDSFILFFSRLNWWWRSCWFTETNIKATFAAMFKSNKLICNIKCEVAAGGCPVPWKQTIIYAEWKRFHMSAVRRRILSVLAGGEVALLLIISSCCRGCVRWLRFLLPAV